MDKHEYMQLLSKKVREWGKQLSILRDDLERGDADDKEEDTLMFQELMRNYEGIESYIDEIEEMSNEDFADEQPMLEERVSEFEKELTEAREGIQDV